MRGRTISTVLFAGAFLGVSADFAIADGGSWQAVRSMVNERHREGAASHSLSRHRGDSSAGDAGEESRERMAAASGHYARARALLIEALAEFERGQKIARPDLLLNPDQWRGALIARKDELDRLLNPQPRVSRIGARFVENRELLREPKEGYVAPPSSGDNSRSPSHSTVRTPSASAPLRAEERPSVPPATTGRGQLRGTSPANAVPAPAPDRASKLKLKEESKEGSAPIIRAPQNPVKKEEAKKAKFEEVSTKTGSAPQEAPGQESSETSAQPTRRGDEGKGEEKTKDGSPQKAPRADGQSDKALLAPEVMPSGQEKDRPRTDRAEVEPAKSITPSEKGDGVKAPDGEQQPKGVEEKSAPQGEAVKESEATQGGEISRKAESQQRDDSVQSEEDPTTTKAIQDALIQERLKRLTEEIAAEEMRQKGR